MKIEQITFMDHVVIPIIIFAMLIGVIVLRFRDVFTTYKARDNLKISWKYFKQVADKLGVELTIPRPGFFINQWPKINGTVVQNDTFSIYVTSRGGGRQGPPIYFINIYIETVKISGLRFSICNENALMKVAKKFWATDIQMNHEEFDKLFMLISSDEDKMRKILSNESCSTLASYGNDLSPEINYENGVFKYIECGIPLSKEDVERIYSVLGVLLDICERMRKLKTEQTH